MEIIKVFAYIIIEVRFAKRRIGLPMFEVSAVMLKEEVKE